MLISFLIGFSTASFCADREPVVITIYCSLDEADPIILDSSDYIAFDQESFYSMTIDSFGKVFKNCLDKKPEGTTLVKVSGLEQGSSGSSKPIKLKAKDGKVHEIKREFLSLGVEATKKLQAYFEGNESIEEAMMACEESSSTRPNNRQFTFGLAASSLAGLWFSGPIVMEVAALLYDLTYQPEYSFSYFFFHSAAREHFIYNSTYFAPVLAPAIGGAVYSSAYGATKAATWGATSIKKFSDRAYDKVRSLIRSYVQDVLSYYGISSNRALLKNNA